MKEKDERQAVPPIQADRWQSKLGSVALRFGIIGNLCLAFLFFPVTRGSVILSLFGLTSKACIKYHIWLGHIVMTLFTSHGVCYIIYWIVTKQTSEVVNGLVVCNQVINMMYACDLGRLYLL
ncbi:putative ferric-chelate reductase (NADH) [Helianthus annuus]|uniref:Ferric-chelate reductase (NADH) n=1 Tax=Helianthus annuus TaxID=4232 RepID=A0A9K3GTI5_HELAN|nr:putative ferric-chelate reductase (NADH) [Helianthus annuus]